ncbi:MAG: hypothetical protein NWE80_02680 [Candidatus Bathyarchaeota archaeon]|nr:hypothetical protein [Candidatus Bathyarchaeota archaeon]
MPEITDKNKVSKRLDSLTMKCNDCREEILQKNPQKCPYCGSVNLISKIDDISEILAEIEKLKKAGKYEEAALKYEELEMLEKAEECRNYNIGKVNRIIMECPHCSFSQSLASKKKEITCKHCRRKYFIPKKIRDLL